MRLEGGTHFLSLRRASDYNNHSVHTFRRYDDVLANWKAGDRVSPISPIDNAPLPDLTDGLLRWIHFIGPLHPGKLACTGKVYLSLGLLNVIIITENAGDREDVKKFILQQSTNWEEWSLLGNKLEAVHIGISSDNNIPDCVLKPISLEYEEFKGTIFEYRALIASTIGRSLNVVYPTTSDLLRFDKIFRDILVNQKMTYDSVSKHGLLTIANAVLSRYSSQTFAGTSPILETESHDWSQLCPVRGLHIAPYRQDIYQIQGQEAYFQIAQPHFLS